MNHEALARLLSSDKATYRRRGKEELEKILKADVSIQMISDKHWWEVLWNTLLWESKEIQHHAKKSVQQHQVMFSNAVFVKQVFRHGACFASFTAVRTDQVLSHLLSVLYDRGVDSRCKDEHKELLADLLLNAKFSFFVSEDDILSILNYVKQNFDYSSVSNRLSSKLLRALPTALYCDLKDPGLLDVIFDWYCSLVVDTPPDASDTSAALVGICADLFCVVIDYFGVQSGPAVFSHAETLLSRITRVLTQPVSSLIRDSVLNFLVRLECVSRQSAGGFRLYCSHQFALSLNSIYDILTRVDSLRILLFSNPTPARAIRDSGSRAEKLPLFDDPRVRLYFDSIVATGSLVYLCSAADRALPLLDTPLLSLCASIEDVLVLLRGHTGPPCPDSGTATSDRTAGARNSYLSATQQLIPLVMVLCSYASKGSSLMSMISSTFSKESSSSVSQRPMASQQELQLLLKFLSCLRVTLSVMRRHEAVDFQLEAVIMWCLVELVSVSGASSSSESADECNPICAAWEQIANVVLDRVSPFNKSATTPDHAVVDIQSSFWKAHVADAATLLLSELLVGSALRRRSSVNQLTARLWNTAPLQNPRLAESPYMLSLLRNLLLVSKCDIPDTLGEVYRQYAIGTPFPGNHEPSMSHGFTVSPVLRAIQYTLSWIEEIKNNASILFSGYRSVRWPLLSAGAADSLHETMILLLVSPDRNVKNSTASVVQLNSIYNVKAWIHSDSIESFTELFKDAPEYVRHVCASGLDSRGVPGEDVSVRGAEERAFPSGLLDEMCDLLQSSARNISEAKPSYDEKNESFLSWFASTGLVVSLISTVVHTVGGNSLEVLRDIKWKLVSSAVSLLHMKLQKGSLKDYECHDCCQFLDSVLQRLNDRDSVILEAQMACRAKILDIIATLRGDMVSNMFNRGEKDIEVDLLSDDFDIQPQMNRRQLTPVCAVDEDDFMDAAPTSAPSRAGTPDSFDSMEDKPQRLCMSTERRRILMYCARCLVSSNSCSDSVEKLQSLLTGTGGTDDDCRGGAQYPQSSQSSTREMVVPSELWLALGDSIADIFPSMSTFSLLLNAWDKDWAGLGYCKVLEVLRRLMRSRLFFQLDLSGETRLGEAVNEDLVCDCADIVFAEHMSICDFPDLLWRIRALQIACSKYIFRTDPVKFKEKYARCVLAGLTDRDFRVRQVAAANIGTLFDSFRKSHFAIYKSMTRGLSTWLQQNNFLSPDEVPKTKDVLDYQYSVVLNAASSTIAVSSMACSGDSLLRLAFRDMILLCVVLPFRRLPESAKRVGWMRKTLSSLLMTCSKAIAHRFHYVDVRHMISDHARLLICDWVSSATSQVLEPGPYELEYFPYVMAGFPTMSALLQHWAGFFVPIVCAVTPAEKRWTLLRQYCDAHGVGSQDSGVAQIISSSMSGLRASIAFSRFFTGENSVGFSIGNFPHEHMQTFIKRTLDSTELRKREKEVVVATIVDLITTPLYLSGAGLPPEPVDMDTLGVARLAESVSHVLQTSKCPREVWRVNPSELVAVILARLYETKSLHVIKNICEVSLFLIDLYLYPDKSGLFLNIGRAFCSEQHLSGEFVFFLCQLAFNLMQDPSICPPCWSVKVLHRLVIRLCDNLDDLTLSTAAAVNMATVFCDVYGISSSCLDWHYHNMSNATSCDVECGRYESFSFHHWSNALSDPVVCCLREVALKSLNWLRRHPAEFPTIMQLMLDVPKSGLNNIYGDLRSELELVSFSCAQHCTKDLIQSIVNYSEQLLWGLPVSQCTLWVALQGFSQLLSSDNDLKASGLWVKYKSETMAMIMSLLKVCGEGQGKSIKIFRYSVMHILGMIGAPHIQKVSHSELSLDFKQIAAYGECYDGSDPNHIRVRICLLIFRFLNSSDASLIRLGQVTLQRIESSDCMRGIRKNFTALLPGKFTACIFNRCCSDLPGGSSPPADSSVCDRARSDSTIWDSKGKKYSEWLTVLTSGLISWCFPSEYQEVPEELHEAFSFLDGIELRDSFLGHLGDICKRSVDICEIVLPLLFYSILEAGGKAVPNTICSVLSEKLEENFLSLHNDLSVRVRRLGCRCVWFAMRQDVTAFLNPSRAQSGSAAQGAQSRKRKRGSTDSVNSNTPFNLLYSIDASTVSSAAIHCGSICTASLFHEYFSLKSTQGSAQKQIALDIANYLHDPDALYSVCNDLPSLKTQSRMYSHAELWGEALATYESTLRVGGQNGYERLREPITSAFANVGYHATLDVLRPCVPSHSDEIIMLGSKAERRLNKWNSSFDSSPDGVLLTTPLDRISALCVRDMKRNKFSTIKERIASFYEDEVYPSFCSHVGDETVIFLVQELRKLQQLTEVEEVGALFRPDRQCTAYRSSTDPLLHNVFESWNARMESMSGVLSVGQKILSHRLILVQALLEENKMTPRQGVAFLNQFNILLDGPGAGHALSPLWYALKSSLCSRSKSGDGDAVMKTECDLNEVRLMWSKGLCDMALTFLDQNVVCRLKEMMGEFGSVYNRAQSSDAIIEDNLCRTRRNLSTALLMVGEFIVSKKCTRGNDDVGEYLASALSHADEVSQKIKAHSALGNFSYHLHQSLKSRIESPEWLQSKHLAADRELELQQCIQDHKIFTANLPKVKTESHIAEHRNRSRHIRTLQKEIEIDTKERDATESLVESVLLESLSNYGSVAALSPDSELSTIFRIVSLWLDNADKDPVNDRISHIFSCTASFKFVLLTYQIFSRSKTDLGATHSQSAVNTPLFTRVVSDMVLKLCRDHPYHTLPQLFAMTQENSRISSPSVVSGGLSSTGGGVYGSTPSSRVLLNLLSRSSLYLGRLISSMGTLLEEYIRIAFHPVDHLVKAKRISNIPFSEIAGDFQAMPFDKYFEQVKLNVGDVADDPGHGKCSDCAPAVLTCTVELRRDCDYADVVRTINFKSTFSITETGLSRPKIIVCEGSDGRRYKQLVKGGDDMRQDAVMEQVFEHVNSMLRLNKETEKRHLCVRTYKIVPMTPQAGVVEWVNNTIQFGHYLTNSQSGAHGRYHPDDLSHYDCRKIMTDHGKEVDASAGPRKTPSKSLPRRKEDVFRDVCSRFRPAFRYFFLESYADPAVWMSRRTAYTRSLAVSSMVGYILGIGDRHSQNILIDVLSAEVVHIDFGIMFEQGKILGTPETVPFRLTRDIVDGMGVNGCEGTFRRCCEEVLRVLRENFSQILTILEVVIHDPLYKWTLSPLQARKKQQHNDLEGDPIGKAVGGVVAISGSESSSSRDAAKRTLLRIKNKLQGSDDPTGDILSVKGQVSMLINEATSEANLCRLFVGWAPWL